MVPESRDHRRQIVEVREVGRGESGFFAAGAFLQAILDPIEVAVDRVIDPEVVRELVSMALPPELEAGRRNIARPRRAWQIRNPVNLASENRAVVQPPAPGPVPTSIVPAIRI